MAKHNLNSAGLLVALLVWILPDTFARAQGTDESKTRTYWCFLTTRETEDRPVVARCTLSWAGDGTVTGSLAPDDLNAGSDDWPEWVVKGQNSAPGVLDLSIAIGIHVKDKIGNIHLLTGERLLSGVLRKSIRGRQIVWEGAVVPIGLEKLANTMGQKQLQYYGLLPPPKTLNLQLISFTSLKVWYEPDGGIDSTEASATWPLERDKEARAWLTQNDVELPRDENGNAYSNYGDGAWVIELPAFSQDLSVYRMLRSGIFDQVIREAQGAGGGADEYFVSCAQNAVFTHPPDSADGLAESLAFTRRFVADLAALPQYRQVRVEDPVVVRSHQHRVTIVGPSPVIAKGPKGYWDLYVLDFQFSKGFSDGPDGMQIVIGTVDAKRAKWPAGSEPPRDRFEVVDEGLGESSDNMLAAFGTILGERVKATRQGM